MVYGLPFADVGLVFKFLRFYLFGSGVCSLSGQLGKEHRRELWKNERSERLAGDEGEEEKGKVF